MTGTVTHPDGGGVSVPRLALVSSFARASTRMPRLSWSVAMLWTLYRYILLDLLRLLGLAGGALVLLMSTAALIKPMSEGLLSPASAWAFLGVLLPTSLTHALPFAGCFASVLLFNRLAQDHELLAARASGISYPRLLLPVVALGLALTVASLGLSMLVNPWMHRRAERMIQRDAVELIRTQARLGRPIEGLAGATLYADAAELLPPPPAQAGQRAPDERMRLWGLAVKREGGSDRSGFLATAAWADLLIYRLEDRTLIGLRLHEATAFDPQGARVSSVANLSLGQPLALRQVFRERPRFMDPSGLWRIWHSPRLYPTVARAMRRLRRAMAEATLRRALPRAINDGQALTLLGPGQERVRLRAQRADTPAQPTEPIRLSQGVELVRRDGRGQPLHARAEAALLWIEPTQNDPRLSDPMVKVRLLEAHVAPGSEIAPAQPPDRPRWDLPPMRVGPPLSQEESDPAQAAKRFEELMSLARDRMLREPTIRPDVERLAYERVKMRRRILSEVHERLAGSSLCGLVVLLGAVLSIRRRASMPLVVYFWAFMTTAASMLLIYTAENLTTITGWPAWPGVAMTWSGVGLMILVVWVNARMLR